MEKRMFVAIALSMSVLLAWSFLGSKTQPTVNKQVINQTNVTLEIDNTARQVLSQPSAIKEKEILESAKIKFSLPGVEVLFKEPGAAISEAIFSNYQSYKFLLHSGFLLTLGDKDLVFQKQTSAPNSISFVHKDLNKEIIKRFIFSKSNYTIELDIETRNTGTEALKTNVSLLLGRLNFAGSDPNARYQDVIIGLADKTMHNSGRKDETFSGLKFLGFRDRYFCSIIEPVSGEFSAVLKKINNNENEIGVSSQEFILAPGQSTIYKFRIYLGPQDLGLINQIKPEWSAIIYYGTFDIISNILFQILNFIYQIIHNWGWAIVILSLLIYLILFPLSLKQMRSMREMQLLQPKIEEIRKMYKDNPQRLNKEIMELYREHKVNPLGGCLPMLLQIPIFFALYQVLTRTIVLKGAKFLWMKDLSEPDRLFTLQTSIPIVGNEVNILPVLMGIGMFFQQKMSMVSSSSGSAEQQKIMLILFPIMFTFIFYHMPSGLVLYWFINSALMLLYQAKINQKK